MLLALALQGSLLAAPLYHGAEPPETRALAVLVVVHDELPAPPSRTGSGAVARSRPAALERARGLAAELAAGADFGALAAERSEHPSAARGGVLGTFPPGVLAPELDAFLFAAEVGARSDVLDTSVGVVLAERIERDAACRQILIDARHADGEERARAVLARLRAGEDFAELARALSEDPASAVRGGQLAIFERGASDALLRAAAFRAEVGETVGPLRTPLGWHLLQRVPVGEVDPALRDLTWVRASSILIAFQGARGAHPDVRRTGEEARALAASLAQRLRAGEDFADLARRFDDDGGRPPAGAAGRAEDGPRGDLGWLRRSVGRQHVALEGLFRSAPGALLGPFATEHGWLLLRRER